VLEPEPFAKPEPTGGLKSKAAFFDLDDNLYDQVKEVFGEEAIGDFMNLVVDAHKEKLVEFLEKKSFQLHFKYGQKDDLESLENEEVMFIGIPAD
jgi:FMN phosphatase YigB (HAD superfamily)